MSLAQSRNLRFPFAHCPSPNPKSKIENPKSKVARRAINRRFLLPMAIQAVPHIQVDGPDRHGLLGHVAVASGAFDSSANVWGVVELHMGRGVIAIDPLPGDFLTALEIGRNLLDLRPVGGYGQVTRHAKLDARQPRIGPLLNSLMAAGALETCGQMDFVSEGDGLLGRASVSKKLSDRFPQAAMSAREHRRGF